MGSAGVARHLACCGSKKLIENRVSVVILNLRLPAAARVVLFLFSRRWATPLCMINSVAGLAARGRQNVQFIDVTGEKVLSERVGLWVVATRNIKKGEELLENYRGI